ncbi:MAG: hypothetical protein KF729_30285 [Sandaracinaceae bacterium]|nr:hypothetical protein [Sandaracinaceae bacterium]
MRTRVATSAAWLTLVLSLPAAAQDAAGALEAARAEMAGARFAEAAARLDAAAAAPDGLDRPALVTLLRLRALARHALRDADAARADLVALLSLEPGATLGAEAPPSLTRALEEARASSGPGLRVDAEASRSAGGFTVSSRASGDPAGLVRRLRVLALREDTVEPHEGARVEIAGEGTLRYVVEAIGPGGAVLATAGTPSAPRELRAEPARVAAPRAASEEGGDDTALIVGIGAGAAAVIAGVAIALAILLAVPDTRVLPPGCEGCP